MNEILAIFAAATFVLLATVLALYKQEVATIIGTIRLGIGWVSALVAAGDHIGFNSLAQPVV